MSIPFCIPIVCIAITKTTCASLFPLHAAGDVLPVLGLGLCVGTSCGILGQSKEETTLCPLLILLGLLCGSLGGPVQRSLCGIRGGDGSHLSSKDSDLADVLRIRGGRGSDDTVVSSF